MNPTIVFELNSNLITLHDTMYSLKEKNVHFLHHSDYTIIYINKSINCMLKILLFLSENSCKNMHRSFLCSFPLLYRYTTFDIKVVSSIENELSFNDEVMQEQLFINVFRISVWLILDNLLHYNG